MTPEEDPTTEVPSPPCPTDVDDAIVARGGDDGMPSSLPGGGIVAVTTATIPSPAGMAYPPPSGATKTGDDAEEGPPPPSGDGRVDGIIAARRSCSPRDGGVSSDDLSTIGLSELLGITDNNDEDADLLSSSETTVSPSPRTGMIDESTEDGGAGDAAAAVAPAPDDGTNDGDATADIIIEETNEYAHAAKRTRTLLAEDERLLDDSLVSLQEVRIMSCSASSHRPFFRIFNIRGIYLSQSISVAILAQRKVEEHDASKPDLRDNNDDEKKRDCDDAAACHARLRDAAARAYHSLVAYGSSVDLSIVDEKYGGGAAGVAFLGEARRSRLSDVGRKLWMTIRNNPGLFSDTIPEDVGAAAGVGRAGDSASSLFEGGRKDRAVAGGYARAIAARLVFLNHIDTRCGVGRPPKLRYDASSPRSSSSSPSPPPSLQELVFGLKLFSRSGKAILEHDRDAMGGARASYDLLALAASCFDGVAVMADGGSGEASEGLREILDEAFDAIAMLPNAASLLGGLCVDDGTAVEHDGIVAPWQTLVLNGLGRVESFVDCRCILSKTGKSQPASKFATLQRFLPSLARLCYKVRRTVIHTSLFRRRRVLIRNTHIRSNSTT